MTDIFPPPFSVVVQEIDALENTETQHGHLMALMRHRAMLNAAPQPPVVEQQVEQEPAPNGATHRQPKQGAFYKRVDGKWYVWSRMENGEPHRWYISPGTSESCLEPLNAAAPQPPAVKDSLTADQPQSVTDCHQAKQEAEQEPVAWMDTETRVMYDHDTSEVDQHHGFKPTVPLYAHPQPPRQPLTDEQIDKIADGMPGGLDGFMKGWGWRQFARAVEAHGIRGEA